MRREPPAKLRPRETLFPGILGYQDRSCRRVSNAILSRHDMILLGLRGQAENRLLRSLTTLLDPRCRTSPAARSTTTPSTRSAQYCQGPVRERGDDTPIAWIRRGALRREAGHADVTIADIIGDVDPIRPPAGATTRLRADHPLRAASARDRGIFALNELPDLAARIQVGLFNILQEATCRSRAIRYGCPWTSCMVFTANPEDYTARGKIITPLKDRIGSEIRTHYPATPRAGRGHHPAGGLDGARPRGTGAAFVREVTEAVAFAARRTRVDRRSGRQPAPAHQRPGERRRSGAPRAGARRAPVVPRSPTFTSPCPPSPASSSWSTKASSWGRRTSDAS